MIGQGWDEVSLQSFIDYRLRGASIKFPKPFKEDQSSEIAGSLSYNTMDDDMDD